MKVMPPEFPSSINRMTASPSAAKYDSATDAIRYSGAISDRMTSASSTPITMIAIGITCARSLLDIALMS